MTQPLPLLVFSDLDGTLLDHETYDFAPALPALRALNALGAGVVLASSKTAAEMAPLRARMDLGQWPAIVENGAGILDPGAEASFDDAPYREIRRRLAGLPSGFCHFRGFGDMTDAEVAKITGLPEADAALARRRQFSEPGLWTGSPAALEQFLDAAENAGLHARRGGRFLTFSHGQTKADRMKELIARLRPARTLALGDAPNDTEMLAAADQAVVIANPHGATLPPLPGEAQGRVTRTTLPGPQGWNTSVLAWVDEYKTATGTQSNG